MPENLDAAQFAALLEELASRNEDVRSDLVRRDSELLSRLSKSVIGAINQAQRSLSIDLQQTVSDVELDLDAMTTFMFNNIEFISGTAGSRLFRAEFRLDSDHLYYRGVPFKRSIGVLDCEGAVLRDLYRFLRDAASKKSMVLGI